MDPHTIELLEFSTVLAQVADHCLSAQGRERLLGEQFISDPRLLGQRLGLARSFRRLLESGREFPPLEFPDLGWLLPRISKPGSAMDAAELSGLGRFLVSAQKLKRAILKGCGAEEAAAHAPAAGSGPGAEASSSGEEEGLAAKAGRIPGLKGLIREIFTVVDADGSLKEKNLPSLREIKARIRRLQQELERLARGYLESPSYRPFWQTATVTLKDGRTVLPLKANFKGRIKGVIHEASGSGATLYLEPLDIVEKNNQIVQRENEYKREAHRILKQVSASVTTQAGDIRLLVALVAELDTLYARAAYARGHRCCPAALPSRTGAGELALLEARHPLLGSRVVPISLQLGGENRLLIITGPNTGGKTLSLKTVGLLSLMNQFALEIPVDEGSRLPVFDDIFADIGDEQSIEQSLSTFSGHIRTISRLIQSSSPRSLVLLDELGAGTDPEEGVAMAMAILDHFIRKRCFALTTTHHGILKNYGYTRAGVQNASMEFDTETLTPTFRIIMGVPGESHAMEIARRTGMPEAILSSAEKYLNEERSDISELIRGLTRKQHELLQVENEHRAREQELRDLRRETDLKDLRLRQKELELREHGVSELKRFLRESRKELESLVRALREQGAPALQSREAQEFTRGIEEYIAQEEARVDHQREEEAGEGAAALERGQEVTILGTGKRGRILRRAKGGAWVVETDTLRAVFPASELRPAAAPPQGREGVSVQEELSGAEPVFQLDLRGLRVEEALSRLEQQIDRAMIRGLSEFAVVHGKGEGVLQQAVHQYLGRRREIKEYFFSSPEEGGFGRTVVRLG